MLSLKESLHHANAAHPTAPVSQFLTLPSELLEYVIELVSAVMKSCLYIPHSKVGHDDYGTESLSLVSSRFRDPVQALLFTTINVVLSRRFLRRNQTFTEWLLSRSRLRCYIKHVVVRPSLPSAPGDELIECSHLARLLPMLNNLRSLSLYALNGVTLPILKSVSPFSPDLEIIMADITLSEARSAQILRTNQPELMADFQHCTSVSIGLKYASVFGNLVSVKDLLANIKNVKAFQLIDDSAYLEEDSRAITSMLRDLLVRIEQRPIWAALEELQLGSRLLFPIDVSHVGSPWRGGCAASIKRLCVQVHAGTFALFAEFVASLKNLESLKFRRRSALEGLTQTLDISQSPFPRLETLRELDMEEVPPFMPLAYFTNPNLRRLKVHCVENMSRRLSEQRQERAGRTLKEISNLHKLCPLLEHLEIDVGDMSTLWHPTAIPGVDVDVQVYRVLNTLTQLPRLRTLRLFPAYVNGDPTDFSWPAPPLKQPLSDEQAIKVFNYLKGQSRSLERLAISTDNTLASRARRFEFHAMSWNMHKLGSRTILVTRQALRDYEQRQVWVGERRLTTEIRRFAYHRPYLPDSPGWIIQPSF